MKRMILKIIRFVVSCAVLLTAALGIAVTVAKDQDFEESFYYIQSDKLSQNIRAVLLSDLHLNEFGKDNKELVERIEELKPDIIAIVGDMNDKRKENYQVVIKLCEQLVDIAPVYYSVGNHEWPKIVNENSKIGEDIEKTGVHLMTDRFETVEINGNTIKIGGLAEAPEQYEKYGKKFFESFETGEEFKLLLVHYPEYFDSTNGALREADIDVAMCGHAHGGQIRIPGIGGVFTKDQGWFPDLTEGVHNINDISVVISRGLGNSSKFPRVNNAPELVIVDMNYY